MPAERIDFFQGYPLLAALVVEQAQLDPLGGLGKQREVRPAPS